MAKLSKHTHSLIFVIVIAIIIASTVAGILFAVGSLTGEIKGSHDVMVEKFNSGEPEEALKELDKLPPEKRGTSESLIWYGKSWYLKAYKEHGDTRWADYGKDSSDWFKGKAVDNAVHFLKQSLSDSSTRAEATFYLALIYMQKGWYDKSERAFKELFLVDKNHREGLLNFAVLKTRTDSYESALKILGMGINQYPEEAEYYKNVFIIYNSHLVDYKKAVEFGDLYLKKAKQGDVGAIRIRRDLIDILARFPELRSDTLELIKNELPEFVPRKR